MTAPVRTIAAKFTAQGSEQVQQAVQRVSQAATEASTRANRAATQGAMAATKTMSSSYASAARGIAQSFDMIAVSGEASGDAIRQLVANTATLASTFGGPLTVAAGLATLAIVNFWSRAREEAGRAREEFDKALRVIVYRGDYAGGGQLLQTLLQGDPTSDDPIAQGGLLKLRGQVADLQAQVDSQAASTATMTLQERIASGRQRELDQLEKLKKALAELEDRYQKAQAAFDKLASRHRETLENLEGLKARPAAAGGSGATGSFVPRALPGLEPTGIGLEDAAGAASGAGVQTILDRTSRSMVKATRPIVQRTSEQLLEEFRSAQSALSLGIGDTIGSAVAGGISEALRSGNVAGAFRSMAQTVLAGLGDVLAQVALRAIKAATLMAKFQSWLTKNPVAAIGVAVAMLALARAMGGTAGGAGGRGGDYAGASADSSRESVTRLVFGNNSVSTAAGMTPIRAVNVTVIGPNDPAAQRGIEEMLRQIQRRGGLG